MPGKEVDLAVSTACIGDAWHISKSTLIAKLSGLKLDKSDLVPSVTVNQFHKCSTRLGPRHIYAEFLAVQLQLLFFIFDGWCHTWDIPLSRILILAL